MSLRNLILIILSAVALNANASKALKVKREVTLLDGRTVTVTLRGDEHVSFYTTNDNEMVLRNDNGYFVASPEQIDSINAICEKVEKENTEALSKMNKRMQELCSATEGGAEAIQWQYVCPSKGKVRIPLLLIEFSDGVTFTFPKEDIDSLFNARELVKNSPYDILPTYYTYSSVGAYFRYCSNNQFDPQFDIYGPYKVSYKSTNFGEGKSIDGLVLEALTLADKDIDFSQYDVNNDGIIDDIYVFYAGYASNTGVHTGAIWPRSSSLTTSTRFDGKLPRRYCGSQELSLDAPTIRDFFGGKQRMQIGVGVHEFCHTLGLPDLYPTTKFSQTSQYDNQSMEDWSLMDNGEWCVNGFRPTPLNAWERAFLGWTEPIEEIKNPCNVKLVPLQAGGKAYMVRNDYDRNEYYILECLPKKSGMYQPIYGPGMLVSHVVWNASSVSSNTVNNVVGKPKFTILPADGFLTSSWNAINQDEINKSPYYSQKDPLWFSGDTYPGKANVTSLTNWKAYTGVVNKPITNIVRYNDGSVTFRFMGGMKGDVNYDGVVDMKDANLVVSDYLGQEITTTYVSGDADLNGDGSITIEDANIIISKLNDR